MRRHGTMHSRHLTCHAVDLVALGGGEVSWRGEDYFSGRRRDAGRPHELEVPVSWSGCWDSFLAIAFPEDRVADAPRPAGQ